MRKIGDRIGALRNADKGTVYLLGYGTYQGEEVPPDDVMGPIGRLGLYGVKNPKLVMDDGTVVWGCECWWGSPEKIAEMIGARRVEIVLPSRTPATDEDRAEAAEIMKQSNAEAERIVEEIKNDCSNTA